MLKTINKKTICIALVVLLGVSMTIATFSTTVEGATEIPTYLFIRAET